MALTLVLPFTLTVALSLAASTSAFGNAGVRRWRDGPSAAGRRLGSDLGSNLAFGPPQYTSAWGLPTFGRQRQGKIHTRMSSGASAKYQQWYAIRGDKWNPKTNEELEAEATDEEIEAILDVTLANAAPGPVIKQFRSTRGDLIRRFRGTILEETWRSIAFNMGFSLALCLLFKRYGTPGTEHPFFKAPPRGSLLGYYDQLHTLEQVWKLQMTITTFTLTFFLNQGYGLWRTLYNMCRKIQGRYNSMGLVIASHLRRTETDGLDPEAEAYAVDTARLIRAFNLLMYAGCSNKFFPIRTTKGIQAMVRRGALTADEGEALLNSGLPPKQRHNAVLVWILMKWEAACKKGLIEDPSNAAGIVFLSKAEELRGTFAAIGDELDARLPLAYAHFVQLMVDAFLVLCPVVLFTSMGGWAIFASGLLTLFYQGLLDLGKHFLDPFDNEGTSTVSDPMNLDTMICETNGGSIRWFPGAKIATSSAGV